MFIFGRNAYNDLANGILQIPNWFLKTSFNRVEIS